MKKVFALFLCVLLMITLCACGKQESVPADEPLPPEETAAETPEEPAAPALPTGQWSDKVGTYTLTITGAETFTDENGADALRVYFDFTNNGDHITSMVDKVEDFILVQDGQELERTQAADGEEVEESYNNLLSIRSGVSIRCVYEMVLLSESAVSLTVTAHNQEELILEHEFDMAALPGAPAEPLPVVPVPDPAWISHLSSEGVYHDDYYVAITSSEITTNLHGEEMLCVNMDFTNNSDEAESMIYAVYHLLAFQDGIQLELYDYENYYTEAQPGETVTVTLYFVPKSASPVEIEVYDPWNDGGQALVIPIA